MTYLSGRKIQPRRLIRQIYPCICSTFYKSPDAPDFQPDKIKSVSFRDTQGETYNAFSDVLVSAGQMFMNFERSYNRPPHA
jgi:hypothetical protein